MDDRSSWSPSGGSGGVWGSNDSYGGSNNDSYGGSNNDSYGGSNDDDQGASQSNGPSVNVAPVIVSADVTGDDETSADNQGFDRHGNGQDQPGQDQHGQDQHGQDQHGQDQQDQHDDDQQGQHGDGQQSWGNWTVGDCGNGSGAASVQGDIRFTDANRGDTHAATTTLLAALPSSGAISSTLLTALGSALSTQLQGGDRGAGGSSDVQWRFVSPAALSSLAAGQSLLVEYAVNISDNHGGVVSQPITLLLNSGSTQPVIVSGVTAAQIAEVAGAAGTSLDAASGVVGLVGGDVTDLTSVSSKLAFANWSRGAAIPTESLAALNSALSASLVVTGDNDGDTSHPNGDDNQSNSATWSFSAADKVFNFLSAGQTLTLAYEVVGKDAHGETVTRLVTVTIVGADHGPVLQSVGGDPAMSDLVGGAGSTTPDVLQANLTFTSTSLTDTHTVSIGAPTATWSGGTAIPQATLSALNTALSDTFTDSTNTGTGSVAMTFSVADGLFHFLSQGETLTVVYNVTVADTHGNTTSQPITFVITGVNDAPVLAVDTGVHAFTDVAGGAGSTTADTASVNLAFTDPNLDDTHTVSIAAPTATWSGGTAIPAATLTALKSALSATLTDSTHTGAGSVALNFSAADGLFHFLSVGETLTLVYNVTVTDSHGATSTQPVTFTVTGSNDAPVVAADTGVHAFSDLVGGAGSTTPDTASANLTFTDANLDDTHTVSIGAASAVWSGGTAIPTATLAALNSALTATLTDGAQTGTGSVALAFSAADGLFHFLSQGETLKVTYNVTVTDNHGASSSQPVTFTITGVADAPTIAAGAVETVNENAVLSVTSATLAATASDVNLNDPLTVTAVGNAQNGTVSLVNGVVTFTPTANYFGAASYTYTVSDSHGLSTTATANVTVNFVPVAPTIPVPATGSVNENTPLTFTAASLVATAVDVNPNETLSLTSVGGAQNGTVSLTNGVVTFTPTTGFYGTATYQYTVTDNYGLSTTATASVTVNPVSAPPLLTLANTTGPENTAIAVSLSTAVTDPADHISSVVIAGLPVGSVLSDGTGGHSFTATATATQATVTGWTLSQLTITPPTNFVGTIPLTVTSTSQLLNILPASVTGNLTVTSVLDHAAPVALNDTVSVNAGVPKVINVLFNDSEQAGLPLTVTSTTSAAHGTVVINANNTVTYTPTAGYTGADSFTYTESDGRGGTATATVNLSIRPPSPAVAPLIAVGSNTTIIPTDGSAIKTVLTLHAGDVVSFNWNFATTDYAPYKDFAFATVNGTAYMLADTQSVGNGGAAGIHTFTYTATTAGTYTFGAGVMNDQDQNYNSYLSVDNLAVNGNTVQAFSNGLTGLNGVVTTAVGTVVEASQGATSNGVTLTPGNGTSEAFLTSAPVLESNLETFLGLSQGQLAHIPLSLGNEYTPIVLPISVTPAINNPDDTYVTVSGAPVGTVFNHGVYDSVSNTWKIEASDLGGDLTLTTPSNYSGSFTLSVTATSVSIGTNTTATTAAQTQLVSVTAAAVTLDGSAGGQTLIGGTLNDTITGGPGDTLTGGGGNDTFIFLGTTFGQNVITDFVDGNDVLQFSHTVFSNAATALSHAAQVGSDVVITFDANDTVTLKNVLLANLHASDFHII